MKADLRLPVLDLLPDGSYLSVVAKPTHDKARNKLIAAARAGEHLDPAQAMRVRVIEYEIPDRDGDGELIALITTITDPAAASAAELAQAYCQRWERRKPATISSRRTCAGLARCCGPKSPDMVRQEDLRLPAHSLRHLGADLPGRHRSRHRPRPGQVPAHRPHHPAPGR